MPSIYGAHYDSAVAEGFIVERRITPAGGFYINSKAGDYFWFKHEVNYINRGYSYDSAGLRVNQHYLDVYPLSPTFHFKGGQLFAGPSASFLIVHSQEIINSNGDKEIVYETEDRNILEFGLVAGIEYEFPFGVNIGARYIRGFTSWMQPVKNQPRVEIFNQAFLFTAGFTFGAKEKKAAPSLE
jgi:hypothetical protein